jgi:hypothetical protein
MTAPKSNFCCATDLALISEPVTSGGGIIGIVSYKSRQGVPGPTLSSPAIKFFLGAVGRIPKPVQGKLSRWFTRQGI